MPTLFAAAIFSSVSPGLTMIEDVEGVEVVEVAGETTEVAMVVGTAVDAKIKEVDSSVGTEVVFVVEFEIWRRARWICGCGGANAVALSRKTVDKAMRSVIGFIMQISTDIVCCIVYVDIRLWY
jgi:hypothetical protein